MTRVAVAFLAVALMFAMVVPAYAVDGSGGAGAAFGQHHAEHAQTMGGFTGVENPGVTHQGFSGWTGP